MIYIILTYEHWSSGCAAVVCTLNSATDIPIGWEPLQVNCSDFESAKSIAYDWLMRSEERIGYCEQDETPQEIETPKNLADSVGDSLTFHGAWCRYN